MQGTIQSQESAKTGAMKRFAKIREFKTKNLITGELDTFQMVLILGYDEGHTTLTAEDGEIETPYTVEVTLESEFGITSRNTYYFRTKLHAQNLFDDAHSGQASHVSLFSLYLSLARRASEDWEKYGEFLPLDGITPLEEIEVVL